MVRPQKYMTPATLARVKMTENRQNREAVTSERRRRVAK